MQVISDRRPTLIRADDLRGAGGHVPWPDKVDLLYAVLQVGADGLAACAYFSQTQFGTNTPLLLLDFEAEPLTGKTISAIAAKLNYQASQIKSRTPHTLLMLPEKLALQVRLRQLDANVMAEVIPEYLLDDPAGLALSAAANTGIGRVQITAPAAATAETHPLGGALNFRAGDEMDADPLRLAMLLGITIGLDDEAARTRRR